MLLFLSGMVPKKFWLHSSLLAILGQPVPHESGVIPVREIGTTVKALRQHLCGNYDCVLHCWDRCMHMPSLI